MLVPGGSHRRDLRSGHLRIFCLIPVDIGQLILCDIDIHTTDEINCLYDSIEIDRYII